MVKQPTHNRLSLGSIPSWPTKHLAFVQRIGHDSSKVIIVVRFHYAGPEHCEYGEIGIYKRLKISRSQGHAGSIPATRTTTKGTV